VGNRLCRAGQGGMPVSPLNFPVFVGTRHLAGVRREIAGLRTATGGGAVAATSHHGARRSRRLNGLAPMICCETLTEKSWTCSRSPSAFQRDVGAGGADRAAARARA